MKGGEGDKERERRREGEAGRRGREGEGEGQGEKEREGGQVRWGCRAGSRPWHWHSECLGNFKET